MIPILEELKEMAKYKQNRKMIVPSLYVQILD